MNSSAGPIPAVTTASASSPASAFRTVGLTPTTPQTRPTDSYARRLYPRVMSQHYVDGDDDADVDPDLADELDARAEAALSGDEFVSFEEHAARRTD